MFRVSTEAARSEALALKECKLTSDVMAYDFELPE